MSLCEQVNVFKYLKDLHENVILTDGKTDIKMINYRKPNFL
jgi:hypothetical protein